MSTPAYDPAIEQLAEKMCRELIGHTPPAAVLCATRVLAAFLAERNEEITRLRAFAHAILQDFPKYAPEDEFKIQEIAAEHGLLAEVEVTEPCGEGCWCAGYGDFPTTCYRRTRLLTGEEG